MRFFHIESGQTYLLDSEIQPAHGQNLDFEAGREDHRSLSDEVLEQYQPKGTSLAVMRPQYSVTYRIFQRKKSSDALATRGDCNGALIGRSHE